MCVIPFNGYQWCRIFTVIVAQFHWDTYSVIMITFRLYKEVLNSIYVRNESCYYGEFEKSVKDLVLRVSPFRLERLKGCAAPKIEKKRLSW